MNIRRHIEKSKILRIYPEFLRNGDIFTTTENGPKLTFLEYVDPPDEKRHAARVLRDGKETTITISKKLKVHLLNNSLR